LDAWHVIIECSRYKLDRDQALAGARATAGRQHETQRRAGGIGPDTLPPVAGIRLDTDHGRWQFFCLCLGGRWDADPAHPDVSAGDGDSAARHTRLESRWQRAFSALKGGRSARSRSLLATATYPVLMKYAAGVYEAAVRALEDAAGDDEGAEAVGSGSTPRAQAGGGAAAPE
jgi:hypothetical protein